MVELIFRPIYRLDLSDYRSVMRFLLKLEKKDWARLRRSAGTGLKKAWSEAIRRSNIQQRTGWLEKSARVRSIGRYAVQLEVIAHYAPALYYGANPSPGRYVPFMPCIGRGARLVNPWRRVKVKLKEYTPLIKPSGISMATYKKWKQGSTRGRFPEGWKLVQYDIGIHPGINARKLGLRDQFEFLAPLYAGRNVIKTLERITGVKLY